MSNCGERFKFFRESFGFSQIQLAKSSGLDVSLIQRIELGSLDVLDLTLRQYYKIVDVYYSKSHSNGSIIDYYFKLYCDFRWDF